MWGVFMKKSLEDMARRLVIHSLTSTTAAKSGHPTTCMSLAEIMSCLFFSPEGLRDDDEHILSEGHAAPILWAAYAEAGVFPIEKLSALRKIDSYLEGHPTYRMPMVKIATGSLGQGLSAGIGMALGKKLDKSKGLVYVIMGDGEATEGSVWEAVNYAGSKRLGNLCAILNINRLSQSGETMYGYNLRAYENKFRAGGWNTLKINGHNINHIRTALKHARHSRVPCAILAKTKKGKGVSFLEDKEGWHGKPLNQEQLDEALAEIGKIHETKKKLVSHVNMKDVKDNMENNESKNNESKEDDKNKAGYPFVDFKTNNYVKEQLVSTRTAYGKALVNLGEANDRVVVLDADVKNSTMQEEFFKRFPERSFQFYIAEQNMVGAAAGLSGMGFIPCVSTFGAFLTRAHDQIRMSQYSNSNIKFAGSHAGVSIGKDGPSQMGLEDLAMFISMPKSVVFYTCDAVSTEKGFKEGLRHRGIFYLRTTREKTKVLYDNHEEFPIGGLKVLRRSDNDEALVIGAGVTVFEALKAYEKLQNENKNIRVIDLYSVKPLAAEDLMRNAQECNGKVIVVEDHYEGGIGPQVAKVVGPIKHLYINDVPRSGEPEQLRAMYGVDAKAIVDGVHKI